VGPTDSDFHPDPDITEPSGKVYCMYIRPDGIILQPTGETNGEFRCLGMVEYFHPKAFKSEHENNDDSA
jgi:hypothetical protein